MPRSKDPDQAYADGTEAMAIAGELYRRGESVDRMAQHTGLSHQTIVRLAMGEAPRIWRSTNERALRLRELLPDD